MKNDEKIKWNEISNPPKDNRDTLLGYEMCRVDTMPRVFYEKGIWYFTDNGGFNIVPKEILDKYTHWLFINPPNSYF